MEGLEGLDNGSGGEVRTRPALVETKAPEVAKKPGRQPIAPEKIAELIEMRKTMPLAEIATKTGLSLGTIVKYTRDPNAVVKTRAKRAAKPAVKVAAKRAPRAVAAPKAPKSSDKLKARLYDLFLEGFSAAEIKAAL